MSATMTATRRPRPQLVLSDRAFNFLLGAAALTVLGLVVVLGATLAHGASPAIEGFGWRFLIDRTWDPVQEHYGALPFIYGTLVSSLVALVLALPVGLGTAVFLAEVAPRWISRPVGFLVELVAAVPSVVLGMWALFVAVPVVREFETFIIERWGHIFLFSGVPLGIGMFMAAIVLAIMILPFIASIARESLEAVPRAQLEAGLALGTTHWEAIRGPLLRSARKGIIGGVVLALGRALGETMAVTMVIGNVPIMTWSLFDSGYTMAALLANEFGEATETLHLGSLVAIALVLMGVTVVVNGLARIMIWGAAARTGEGQG